VTSVPWQLASTASKNLDRLDATLSRGPARGPRVAPQSTLPPPVASTPSAPSAPSTPSAPSAEREERP